MRKAISTKAPRIINWCPVCQTSISDAEVEHEDQDGHLLAHQLSHRRCGGKFVEIATTRPETLLGDTAVAVNPDDERYQASHRKDADSATRQTVRFRWSQMTYVDKEFGTGVRKDHTGT
ncbi:MAG: hypothetical protein ACLR6B_15500 [Blautia sp.]